MKLFYFSLLTVVATWILLVIGGLVNPMGASMACPDWYFVPTCNGELLPEMMGGVLYEHGHRLWASLVGILTIALAVSIFVSRQDARLRILGLVAVLLVALQGTLGGITVLLNLSFWVSTLHLGCAMAFLCLLIYITFLLYPNRAQIPVSNSTRIWVRAAFALTFFQILLGGLVRHLGAGLACGDDWLSCGPSIWPSWQLGQLHMTHRLVGYVLVVIITVACIKSAKTAKKAESRFARITGLVVAHLVMIQILLGMATVATVRSVALVTAHTAIGALLLAALFLLLVTQKYPFKSDL